MNHFKSLKIGNSPLLIMGCIIIAFGVTHFYYGNADSPKIELIIGHILLFPIYFVDGIISRFGFNSIMNSPVIVFLVLLFTYACIVLIMRKIFAGRRSPEP